MAPIQRDPLAGLAPFIRNKLWTDPLSWSERWRLCNPALTAPERTALVHSILTERRAAYDIALYHQTKAAELERAHQRYQDREVHLTIWPDYLHATRAATSLRAPGQCPPPPSPDDSLDRDHHRHRTNRRMSR